MRVARSCSNAFARARAADNAAQALPTFACLIISVGIAAFGLVTERWLLTVLAIAFACTTALMLFLAFWDWYLGKRKTGWRQAAIEGGWPLRLTLDESQSERLKGERARVRELRQQLATIRKQYEETEREHEKRLARQVEGHRTEMRRSEEALQIIQDLTARPLGHTSAADINELTEAWIEEVLHPALSALSSTGEFGLALLSRQDGEYRWICGVGVPELVQDCLTRESGLSRVRESIARLGIDRVRNLELAEGPEGREWIVAFPPEPMDLCEEAVLATGARIVSQARSRSSGSQTSLPA